MTPHTKREFKNNKAQIGDSIEFLFKGEVKCQGIVEKVYENSVLVIITLNGPITDKRIVLPEKTVVNYKRYKVIKKA